MRGHSPWNPKVHSCYQSCDRFGQCHRTRTLPRSNPQTGDGSCYYLRVLKYKLMASLTGQPEDMKSTILGILPHSTFICDETFVNDAGRRLRLHFKF